MKKLLKKPLFFFCFFYFYHSNAQTTLSIGDIAFTGYNSDGTDDFSFIILRTGGIASSTTIKFTDYGWSSGACGSNGWAGTAEEENTWTTASALPYGTQVRINGLTASSGTVSGTAMNLSSVGDQLFAFQGNRTGVHTLIAGIHMNFEIGTTSAANWDNAATPTGTQSNRPACLTNGTYALFFDPEVDNARLKTSVLITGTPATDRANINNAANWDTDDVTPFTLPAPLIFLPVKFTYVRVSGLGNPKIEWGIADEQNIESYTVERSIDGRTFITLITLPSSGASTYSWADVISNTVYYRVRANEINGSVKYSSIVKYTVKIENQNLIVSFKNDMLSLRIVSIPKGNYSVLIYSGLGALVESNSLHHSGGNGNYEIDLKTKISKGIYLIILSNEETSLSKKVLIE